MNVFIMFYRYWVLCKVLPNKVDIMSTCIQIVQSGKNDF